jgi:hypothetical protein
VGADSTAQAAAAGVQAVSEGAEPSSSESMPAAESACRAKYLSMTLEQLKQVAGEAWLSTSGSKSELVQRLADYERPSGGWGGATPEYVPQPEAQAGPEPTPAEEPAQAEAAEPEPPPPPSPPPPPAFGALIKDTEPCTLEQLRASLAVDPSVVEADRADPEGKTALHRVCEQRLGLDCVTEVAEMWRGAAEVTDQGGRTPLVCLLTGPQHLRKHGDEGMTTEKAWGDHLRAKLKVGQRVRVAREHTKSIAGMSGDGGGGVAGEGPGGTYTGGSKAERVEVAWNEEAKSWVPWSAIEVDASAEPAAGRAVSCETVSYLLNLWPAAISECDEQGRLPLEIALLYKLPTAVVNMLAAATKESKVIWFGEKNSSDEDGTDETTVAGHSFHVLLHAACQGAATAAGSKLPKELQLPSSLEHLGANAEFATATCVRGLPFAASEIVSSCCRAGHVALLVRPGKVFRFEVQVRTAALNKLSRGTAKPATKSPAQLKLERTQMRLDQQIGKIEEMKLRLAALEKQKHPVSTSLLRNPCINCLSLFANGKLLGMDE